MSSLVTMAINPISIRSISIRLIPIRSISTRSISIRLIPIRSISTRSRPNQEARQQRQALWNDKKGADHIKRCKPSKQSWVDCISKGDWQYPVRSYSYGLYSDDVYSYGL